MSINIFVHTDFSVYPGLRHVSMSQSSGEEFYHKILNGKFYEAYSKGEMLVLNLDNTGGYPPSFIDESIGNLVYDFSLAKVKEHLTIISEQEPSWLDYLNSHTYPLWEQRRIEKSIPKKTISHEPWYQLNNSGNVTLNNGYSE
ncbi:MAG: hypothetical protein H6Q15_2212 [Bacteroidetes bacterium]|nr:hypothetical protein [Bacteroidota bacterium]